LSGEEHKVSEDVDPLINISDGEKSEKVHNDLEDSMEIELIPPSPNYSCVSFPELYEKESQHDVSDFLEKLQHSDYEDNVSVSGDRKN
jgi:hypothetical protein